MKSHLFKRTKYVTQPFHVMDWNTGILSPECQSGTPEKMYTHQIKNYTRKSTILLWRSMYFRQTPEQPSRVPNKLGLPLWRYRGSQGHGRSVVRGGRHQRREGKFNPNVDDHHISCRCQIVFNVFMVRNECECWYPVWLWLNAMVVGDGGSYCATWMSRTATKNMFEEGWVVAAAVLWALLLTWFNFNTSMDM